MSARSKARKRALDILFEAELRGVPVLDMLDERAAQASPPVSAYASELVRGVQANRESIDEMLATHSTSWPLNRMPAVDRNILRIGAYELLWSVGVPEGVAISEAVLLARDLSTDASPAFINGMLARLLELKPENAPGSVNSDRPGDEPSLGDKPSPGVGAEQEEAPGLEERPGLEEDPAPEDAAGPTDAPGSAGAAGA